MFNSIDPIIKILFANEGASRQPIEFEWWLIRRRGLPFLLLPTSPAETHVALELYSAQRLHAKILRAILPLLLKTPLARLFPKVRIRADAASELLQFMSQQSGVPAGRLRTPAIKIGGLAIQKARLVMLLCDEAKRPVKVIKIGLNPRGWVGLLPDGLRETEQEADQLERLPPNIIGCIRMTGRICTPALSAFAITYFSGDSPNDDAGMEHLFHSWLNPEAPMPIENLQSWRELETAFSRIDPSMWQILNQAVAKERVHSTIHHGDFAPWNIRATSSENLQVFDWERGLMQGIPGWDWFHFFVQTSILARRCSEKRVAAEIEHLFRSPRFRIYAAAARITHIIRPLFLGYLLHQKYVVKPLAGGETTEKLYELLADRWGLKPASRRPAEAPQPVAVPKLSLGNSIRHQLWFAISQLSNLIWEPSLTSITQPKLLAELREHWKLVALNVLSIAAIITIHNYSRPYLHLSFIGFYLIPCVWLTVKLNRVWGGMAATASAIIVPGLHYLQANDSPSLRVTLWNMVMLFIFFHIVVSLTSRSHQQDLLSLFGKSKPRVNPAGSFANYWAVVVMAGLVIAGAALLDFYTSPQLSLLPLYLLPCIMLTLVLNRRWGTAAAIVSAIIGPFMQRFEAVYYQNISVELWNTVMRFIVFQSVVIVLDAIRRENIVFFFSKPEAGAAAFAPPASEAQPVPEPAPASVLVTAK